MSENEKPPNDDSEEPTLVTDPLTKLITGSNAGQAAQSRLEEPSQTFSKTGAGYNLGPLLAYLFFALILALTAFLLFSSQARSSAVNLFRTISGETQEEESADRNLRNSINRQQERDYTIWDGG